MSRWSHQDSTRVVLKCIELLNNPKIKFIIDKIVDTPDEKFIVYSSLYDAGIQLLKVGLKNNNIKFAVISGKETAKQKNNSKILFNTYNFNGKYLSYKKKLF